MAGVLELMSRAVRPLRPVDEVARSAAKSELARIKTGPQPVFTILVLLPTRYRFPTFLRELAPKAPVPRAFCASQISPHAE